MISKNSWQNSLFDSVSPQSPWSQEPCLCSHHCTHSGQSIITCYSVRQHLWRLGRGSNTILAVISTLFYIEMELISARVPRSKGETQPSWKTQVKNHVPGAARRLCSYSGDAWLWTYSQVLQRPIRRRWTGHIFPWQKEKAPRPSQLWLVLCHFAFQP